MFVRLGKPSRFCECREECLGVRASALASRLTRDSSLPVMAVATPEVARSLSTARVVLSSLRWRVVVCFLCCVLSSLSAPSIFTSVCLSPPLCCKVSFSGSWDHVQLKAGRGYSDLTNGRL